MGFLGVLNLFKNQAFIESYISDLEEIGLRAVSFDKIKNPVIRPNLYFKTGKWFKEENGKKIKAKPNEPGAYEKKAMLPDYIQTQYGNLYDPRKHARWDLNGVQLGIGLYNTDRKQHNNGILIIDGDIDNNNTIEIYNPVIELLKKYNAFNPSTNYEYKKNKKGFHIIVRVKPEVALKMRSNGYVYFEGNTKKLEFFTAGKRQRIAGINSDYVTPKENPKGRLDFLNIPFLNEEFFQDLKQITTVFKIWDSRNTDTQTTRKTIKKFMDTNKLQVNKNQKELYELIKPKVEKKLKSESYGDTLKTISYFRCIENLTGVKMLDILLEKDKAYDKGGIERAYDSWDDEKTPAFINIYVAKQLNVPGLSDKIAINSFLDPEYTPDLVFKIKEKIYSEEIEGIKKILEVEEAGHRRLFLADTSAGKTYAFINYLKKNQKSLPYDKVIFTVPNVANAKQIGKEYGVGAAFGIEKNINYEVKNNFIIATTWDKVGSINKELLGNYLVINDEIQGHTLDYGYRGEAIGNVRELISGALLTVDVTATPLKVHDYDLIVSYEVKKKPKIEIRVSEVIREDIEKAISQAKGKVAILQNHKGLNKELANKFDFSYVDAENKNESDLYKRIVQTSYAKESFVCTSLFTAGVNIKDKDFTDVHIINYRDVISIKQFIARFREVERLRVWIWLDKKDSKEDNLFDVKAQYLNDLEYNRLECIKWKDVALKGKGKIRIPKALKDNRLSIYFDAVKGKWFIDKEGIYSRKIKSFFMRLDLKSFGKCLKKFFPTVIFTDKSDIAKKTKKTRSEKRTHFALSCLENLALKDPTNAEEQKVYNDIETFIRICGEDTLKLALKCWINNHRFFTQELTKLKNLEALENGDLAGIGDNLRILQILQDIEAKRETKEVIGITIRTSKGILIDEALLKKVGMTGKKPSSLAKALSGFYKIEQKQEQVNKKRIRNYYIKERENLEDLIKDVLYNLKNK